MKHPTSTPTFPHHTAEKPPSNQHALSTLEVDPNQLQPRLSDTTQPKSPHQTNTFCPLTPERRILNRALFTHITIDDEENATYTAEQTTASILAHTTVDAPAYVTAETKLPRHQAGHVSIIFFFLWS